MIGKINTLADTLDNTREGTAEFFLGVIMTQGGSNLLYSLYTCALNTHSK
jgi:hypothetical protein